MPLHLLGISTSLISTNADLHAPGLGELLDDVAQVGVQGAAVGEHGVQVDPTEDRSRVVCAIWEVAIA